MKLDNRNMERKIEKAKVEEGNKAAREAKKEAKGKEPSAPLFKRMEQEYKVQTHIYLPLSPIEPLYVLPGAPWNLLWTPYEPL